jgi:hypothetical protein
MPLSVTPNALIEDNLARRLRRRAAQLRADAGATTMELRGILEAHGNASMAMLLVVLAIPAMIPVPGVPVGAIMSFGMYAIAVAMLMGVETVRLPRRLGEVKFSVKVARHILHRLAWLYDHTGRHARPRLDWLAGHKARRWLGVFVALMATVIFLPIPLGNIVPGAALVVLALSLMFMDGLGVLISLAVGGLAFGYIAALGGGAWWVFNLLT